MEDERGVDSLLIMEVSDDGGVVNEDVDDAVGVEGAVPVLI